MSSFHSLTPVVSSVLASRRWLVSPTARMPMSLFLIFALLITLVPASSVLSLFADTTDEFVVFEKTYIRGSGAPEIITEPFSVLTPQTDWTLRVTNGNLEDDSVETVSSSKLILNGTELLQPNDFKQTVSSIELPVILLDSNTLSIELRGKPGGQITVEIIGQDRTSPAISWLVPTEGQFLNTPSIPAQLHLTDDISGLDPAKLEIYLNGVTISNQFSDFATPVLDITLEADLLLTEGIYSLDGQISDLAGHSAGDSTTFTVDRTAPAIADTFPSEGSIVSEAKPAISANYSDALSGIDVSSVQIALDGNDVTSLATVTEAGFNFQPVSELQDGSHSIQLKLSDLAGNIASVQSSLIILTSPAPVLDPIGDQIVSIGSILKFLVSASDPDGDDVELSIAPVPLPPNAAWNATNGEFTFSPGAGQAGIFTVTFGASDGVNTDEETIEIEVLSSSTGITTLSGQVLETGTGIPLENATLGMLGETAITDSDGRFSLSGLTGGTYRLEITGTTALRPGPYPDLFEIFDLIDQEDNVMPFPIFLPILDVANADPVDPNQDSLIISGPVLRQGQIFDPIEILVAAGTATDLTTGQLFTGDISLTVVDPSQAPLPLPDDIIPSLYFAIQPPTVSFDPPAPISFPNLEDFLPGDQVEIFAMNHDTGAFNQIGTGTVSSDGTRIDSDGGVVLTGSWHAFFTAGPSIGPASDSAGDNQDSEKCCDGGVGSQASLSTGNLTVEHQLPTFRSFGSESGPKLVYNSLSANPRLIVTAQSSLTPRTPLPENASVLFQVGGVQQNPEVFMEPVDDVVRQAHPFDARAFSTGSYSYRLQLSCNFPISRRVGTFVGTVLVNNQIGSPFGAGWTLEGLQRLHLQGASNPVLTEGDGSIMRFVFLGGGTFRSPDGDFSTLTDNGNGTFTRRMKDGTEILFDSLGQHTSTTDRNGNVTSYAYDGSGNLTSITDPLGLVTILTYNAGLLESVTDPMGRTTQFQHDAGRNLVGIVDPDGTNRSFSYDSDHLLTSQVNQRSFTTSYAYDNNGRFRQSQLPDGSTRQIIASQTLGIPDTSGGVGLSPLLLAPVVRQSEVEARFIDGNGNVTILKTDQFGAITDRVDPLGKRLQIDRDSDSNPTQITRPNGAVTSLNYDSLGNLLSFTELGISGVSDQNFPATASFSYDPTFNLVNATTDPKGNHTVINRDINGNPTEIIDELGTRHLLRYEDAACPGRLTSITAAIGLTEEATTTLVYDAATNCNMVRFLDPLLNETSFQYDLSGNVTRITDAQGRVSRFEYDLLNRTTKLIDATNLNLNPSCGVAGVTCIAYDAIGNVTGVTAPTGSLTAFQYDTKNRVVHTTDPLGNPETFAYDGNGNLRFDTTRNGDSIEFQYDPTDQLISKILPGAVTTIFDYDLLGNLNQATDPDSALTMTYDSIGRPISSSTQGSPTQPDILLESSYDKNGNRRSLVDPIEELVYRYDELNRLTSIGTGHLGLAFLDQQRFPVGSRPVSIDIADFNNDTFLDAVVANSSGSGIGISVLLGDGAGNFRPQQLIFPGNPRSVVVSELNGDSNPDVVAVFGTDKMVVLLGNGDGTFQEQPQITVSGNVNFIAEGDLGTDGVADIVLANLQNSSDVIVLISNGDGTFQRGKRFNLGNFGRPASVALADMNNDGLSDIVGATFITNVATVMLGNGDGTFRARKFFPVGSTPFSIAAGHLNNDSFIDVVTANTGADDLSVLLGNGDGTFLPQQLLSVGDAPSSVVMADLDLDGITDLVVTNRGSNETSVLLGNGNGTFQEISPLPVGTSPTSVSVGDLDGDARPDIIVTNSDSNDVSVMLQDTSSAARDKITFAYDALSRRTEMKLPNGTTTGYGYDTADRLLNLVNELDSGPGILSSFSYAYDAVGNRTSLTQQRSAVTVNSVLSYVYDDLDRLIDATQPVPSLPNETFTYDAVGSRLLRDGQVQQSDFNVGNQLLEDADFTYDYDLNGNMIRRTEKSSSAVTQYTYDAENQLTRLDFQGGDFAEYRYDALGRRIEKNVDGDIVRYVYDGLDIALEYDGANILKARYVHGPSVDEPLIMERDLDSSGTFEETERFYYHSDALGSITELTDSTGVVTRAYVYDSFGRIVDQVGTLTNHYTYTGREFDGESGLYYYRARYYDPNLGRFVTEDPIGLNGGDLNLYAYVRNSPIRLTDPTGLLDSQNNDKDAKSTSKPKPRNPHFLPNLYKQKKILEKFNPNNALQAQRLSGEFAKTTQGISEGATNDAAGVGGIQIPGGIIDSVASPLGTFLGEKLNDLLKACGLK